MCACLLMYVCVCSLFCIYVCCTVYGRIGGDGVVKVSDFGLAAKLNPGHNQYLRPLIFEMQPNATKCKRFITSSPMVI